MKSYMLIKKQHEQLTMFARTTTPELATKRMIVELIRMVFDETFKEDTEKLFGSDEEIINAEKLYDDFYKNNQTLEQKLYYVGFKIDGQNAIFYKNDYPTAKISIVEYDLDVDNLNYSLVRYIEDSAINLLDVSDEKSSVSLQKTMLRDMVDKIDGCTTDNQSLSINDCEGITATTDHCFWHIDETFFVPTNLVEAMQKLNYEICDEDVNRLAFTNSEGKTISINYPLGTNVSFEGFLPDNKMLVLFPTVGIKYILNLNKEESKGSSFPNCKSFSEIFNNDSVQSILNKEERNTLAQITEKRNKKSSIMLKRELSYIDIMVKYKSNITKPIYK